jgi:hypothetical protein
VTTVQPPAPPPPPGPEAVARMQAENAAFAEQLANQALRQEAARVQAPGRPGSVSVIKDPAGRVVVTTGDGRTVVYDPKVGLDEDAVQGMIQTALEPPRSREPRSDNDDTVRILGILLPFVTAMVFIVVVGRIILRRMAARAGAQAPAPDLTARLARIEQAVEAVAIEVERIAESERYSARLLTERLPERAGAPVPANGQGTVAGVRPGAAGAEVPTLDSTR